ncbi:MAG: S24 family peptidase [Desulfuromonadales bacterium]
MRERLLKGIEAAGYKKHGRVSKLAALTGYSIGQVSDMLSGKVSLNDKFMRLVCNELGFNSTWLETGTGEMFVQSHEIIGSGGAVAGGTAQIEQQSTPVEAPGVLGKVRQIPIISWAQAGTDGFFEDAYAVGSGIGTLNWFDDLKDNNAYALMIRGDSMSPRYDPGDYVIISPAAGVKTGDYAVVKLTDGQVMAKKVTLRNGDFVLSSVNKEYDDLFVAKKDVVFTHKIVGTRPGG